MFRQMTLTKQHKKVILVGDSAMDHHTFLALVNRVHRTWYNLNSSIV